MALIQWCFGCYIDFPTSFPAKFEFMFIVLHSRVAEEECLPSNSLMKSTILSVKPSDWNLHVIFGIFLIKNLLYSDSCPH